MTKQGNANEIIKSGNNETPGVHQIVQSRLDRDSKDVVTESVKEKKVDDVDDISILYKTIKEFEGRIHSMVNQINEQFNDINRKISILEERDKSYKNAFVTNDNKISSVINKVNSIKNGTSNNK